VSAQNHTNNAWCERLQDNCICSKCEPGPTNDACNLCEARQDACNVCDTRIDKIAYQFRFDWITPAPTFKKSWNGEVTEIYLALSPVLIQKIGLVEAAVLTIIHFRLRIEEPDENGMRWYQFRLTHFANALGVSWHTILRAVKELRKCGIVKTPETAKGDYHQGKHYSIDYVRARELAKKAKNIPSILEVNTEQTASDSLPKSKGLHNKLEMNHLQNGAPINNIRRRKKVKT